MDKEAEILREIFAAMEGAAKAAKDGHYHIAMSACSAGSNLVSKLQGQMQAGPGSYWPQLRSSFDDFSRALAKLKATS